jgi:hypothetical protein
MIDNFLPHTVFYTNMGHKDNPAWSESLYSIDSLCRVGIDGWFKILDVENNKFIALKDIKDIYNIEPEITPEQAFLMSIRSQLFSMREMIKVYLEPSKKQIVVNYPKGFCPEFIHLIGKRTQRDEQYNQDDWLVLVSSFNGETSYGDLVYISHVLLKFALSKGHYQLSPNSPVIAPLLEDKKDDSKETDWDQLLKN